ncbi:MAG: hypothetical protein AAF704_19045, partial [Cyanobacteria bacterium P01_D01_bin.123]
TTHMLLRATAITLVTFAAFKLYILARSSLVKPVEFATTHDIGAISNSIETSRNSSRVKRASSVTTSPATTRAGVDPIRLMVTQPATVRYETADRPRSVTFGSSSSVRMWTPADVN